MRFITQLRFHTYPHNATKLDQIYNLIKIIYTKALSTFQREVDFAFQVLALRVSFVGEMGWELHIPNESCVPVYRALMEAGKDKGLVNAGYRAIDSLSIEKGYPHWHAEIK